VFIPTWLRASWLDSCLRSILDQERTPDEVIVGVREEDGEAETVVREHADRSRVPIRGLSLSIEEIPGQAQAVEAGLRETTSEIFVEVDDDVEAEEGWLDALLAPFSERSVACVGGRVFAQNPATRVPRDAGRIRWYGKAVANVSQLPARGVVRVDNLQECNWAWRADALRSLVFDPALQSDAQSMWGLDLCLQARERGWELVYQPEAAVRDRVAPRDPSTSREDAPSRARGHTRNYTYIMLKHLSGWRKIPFCIWWWTMGEPGSYGPVKAAVDLPRRGRVVLAETSAAMAGRAEGVRLWRESRVSRPSRP
jgi:GT2 family glycosyltransferase